MSGPASKDAEEFAKLLGSKSGGAYIPPARLRAMQAEAAKDKTSAEYQRLSWDALRKSINGMINKVSRQSRLETSGRLTFLPGEHLKHQARRTRALRRKPYPREGPFRAFHHACSGIFAAIYSNICRTCGHRQYEVTAGRRAGLDPVDQPISASLQEERQGTYA